MNWLLAVADIPGGGFERPDLPPGTGRLVVLAIVFGVGYLAWSTGLLDPERLLDWLKNRSPIYRLRRDAYGVATRVFSMEPVGSSSKDRATRRATESNHRHNTVPELKRSGGHCVYAEVHYKKGIDTGPGSKLRLSFESVWRQDMTRPDKHGNPAHDWEFKWYTGSPVVVCRICPLASPGALRLYGQLNPVFKWPEGVRVGDIIADTDDGHAVTVPHGFRYDKAETRLGIQRQVNLTVESPTGAWKHDWAPQVDRYTITQVPPLPTMARWEPEGLRLWTPDGPEPALPVGKTHGGETIWWEYQREGQIHAGIFGQTGAGKTGSAQSIVVAALLSGFEKVVILDPKADKDWAWLGGWPKVEFAYDLEHIAQALADVDRLRERRSRAQMQATTDNPHLDPPLAPPVLVFLDEASALFTRQKAGDASKEADYQRSACAYRTNNIAIMGRSANMHLFVGTQRPRADSIDSNTKAQLGFRIGLGDLDSTAARMIFDTTEAAVDRDLGDVLGKITCAGRGYAGTVGSSLTEAQLFYRTRAGLIALLGPPPAPRQQPQPAPEQVFGSQVEGIVVPSVKEPLTDWG